MLFSVWNKIALETISSALVVMKWEKSPPVSAHPAPYVLLWCLGPDFTDQQGLEVMDALCTSEHGLLPHRKSEDISTIFCL